MLISFTNRKAETENEQNKNKTIKQKKPPNPIE